MPSLVNFSWSRSFSALKHRNFHLFFWGQLISVVGIWMQITAQQWLVYRITGSQTSLGMITFIGFLPVLLLSLFMGVITDQFPRRKILIFTQTWFMVLAFVLALLTWLHLIEYWHILVLSFLTGIANALDMPARQSFVVEMVDDQKDDVLNAIGLNSALFNIARIVGPAIGGAVVGMLGESPAFTLNGISYLAVIAALMMMRFSAPPKMASRGHSLDKMKDGFRYIAAEKTIFGLVAVVAGISFIGFGALTLVPVFAKDILQIGAEGFGHLLSAQGVGALFGAAILIFFGDQLHKGKLLIFSRFLLGPGIIALSLSRTPWVSMIVMGLLGYSFITQLTMTNTLIQTIVPDELRGRILSTYTWAIGGFYPLGSLLMGYLGDQLSAPSAALIAGTGTLILVIISLFAFPNVKNLR